MLSRLSRYRTYALLSILALYLYIRHADGLFSSNWLLPGVLLALGAVLAGVEVRFRRGKAALSVTDVFVFGAVVSLPAGFAAAAAAVTSSLSGLGHRCKEKHQHTVLGVRAAAGAAAACLAQLVYLRLLDWTKDEVVALAVAGVCFLTLTSLSFSLLREWTYWRKLLLWRSLSALELAVFLGPGAVVPPLVLAARPPEMDSLPWLLALGAAVFYLLCESWFGPLFEDSWRRDEKDDVYLRAVEALALAVEAKDHVSGTHLKRVQHYCVEIAKALNCSEEEIRALEYGALLHDIGKIAVPEELLTKPSRLSAHEFSRVASHAEIGAEILSAVHFPFPVEEIVRSHHENWDGSGYPRRLKGEGIPFTARILAVVDNFDALTSDRPYRAAMPIPQALQLIQSRKGKAFDPNVVDTLVELLPQLERELQRKLASDAGGGKSAFLHGPRHVATEQTSLTGRERLESLKQNRTAAREPAERVEYASLERLLSSLASTLSVQELLEFLLPFVADKIPFDESAAFLVDGSELKPLYCSGPKANLVRRARLPMGESPTGWVAAYGQSLLNGNPSAEPAELGAMASFQELKSALITPLWATGRVVGTFNLYSKEAGAYSQESVALLESFTRGLGHTLRDISAYEPLERDGRDVLTGLPTAREALRYLDAAIRSACGGRRETVSVLCIDINQFHALNTRRGYSVGNRVLALLSQTLQASKASFEFVSRLGEDRFLAVVQQARRPQLGELVRQLKSVVRERCEQPENGIRESITLSVGRASFPTEASSARELLAFAYLQAYVDKLTHSAISVYIPEGRLGSASAAFR